MNGERAGTRTQDLQIKSNSARAKRPSVSTLGVSKGVVAKRQFPSGGDSDLETAAPLRTTPVVAGVYFLFKDGELTYVGRSNDCYGRIASHRQKGRDFDLATVMPLAMEFISLVETALIDGFTPPQNRMRPAPPPPAPVYIAAPLPPDPYADVPPGAPRPSPLGTITPTQARELALHLGLAGGVIREAEDAGALRFIDTGRKTGRGSVRVAVYDEVLTLLRALRQDKLRALGLAPAVPSPIRSEGA